jgi:hypothetical protein
MRVGTSRGEGQTGAGVHFEYTFNSRVADASCSATEPNDRNVQETTYFMALLLRCVICVHAPILNRPDGSARVVGYSSVLSNAGLRGLPSEASANEEEPP